MSEAAPTTNPPRTMRVALVGNPNVGKTTLFNALTGARQKIANYPGVTVERKVGRLRGNTDLEVIDLPGSYSLNPRSVDERITFEVLVGRHPEEAAPDVAVCVVDATNLERNLYLVSQVLDLEIPTIVALNMTDAAEKDGLRINAERLAGRLGVPVVPLSAKTGAGLEALAEHINDPPGPAVSPDWELMPAVQEPVQHLEEVLASSDPDASEGRRRLDVLGALSNTELLDSWKDQAQSFYTEAHRIRKDLDRRGVPYAMAETSGRYAWATPIASEVVSRDVEADTRTLSDKIDAVVTHRIAGPLIFAGILLLIFQSVFSWTVPVMDMIEGGVAWVGEGVRAVLPAGVVEDALVEGAIAGVGNVLVFLPQILLLFFFLGLMEDTGYMARTAFIMDRLMRSVGLSGSSVVPMLSAYACAIPGIMAARTLADERERIITIMVVPLQGCSARLPVYVLLIGAFVPAITVLGPIGLQGLVMFSLYALGTGMAFVAALILRRLVFKGESSSFVMELPPYRMPQMRMVLRRMVERSKIFVTRAGKIIFGLSIVLWFLASYPTVDPPESLVERQAEIEARTSTLETPEPGHSQELANIDHAIQAHRMRNSFVGRFGRLLEPVLHPLGFDWKISAGIVSSFAAREVMVSALATIYSAGADADETSLSLRDALREDTYPNGQPVFTPLVAISLLVFYVFALQCMSTLAIARRELNSWTWPAVMWGYMFVLAYVFSFAVYQGGKLLGLG